MTEPHTDWLTEARKAPNYEANLRAALAEKQKTSWTYQATHEFVEARQSAEDQFWAGIISPMTDADVEIRIAAIDDEISLLPYRSLTVVIADREAGLRDERTRLVKEQFRRSVIGCASLPASELMGAAE